MNTRENTATMEDTEARALERAIGHKRAAVTALAEAAQLRKRRGGDTTGIEESLEMERLTMAGYQLALDARTRELGGRGRR